MEQRVHLHPNHSPISRLIYLSACFFSVPVAVPLIQDTDEVNSTAAIINWIPVPDDRETMKGRVRGYTVRHCCDYKLVPDSCRPKGGSFILNESSVPLILCDHETDQWADGHSRV